MSNKVFIYARRSSMKNKVDSISIDLQIQEIQKECIEKNLEIEGIYKDNESSFKEGKRNEFMKMLQEIEKRNIKGKGEKIGYIYVYMTSRLARNKAEGGRILDLVNHDIIKILSIRENYEDNLTGKKQLAYNLIDAEFDSKEKSEKGKIHMDETQKEKGKISRRPPFGYKMVFDEFGNKKMVINTDNKEEEIVKKTYKLYATGNYTYKSISEKLNEEGYTKKIIIKNTKSIKYRDFTEKDTRNIIINQFYYGRVVSSYKNLNAAEIKYFKSEYPDEDINEDFIIDYSNFIQQSGNFKAIINKQLFDKCLEIRQGKRGKTKKIEDPSKGPIYIFRTLLKCPCKKEIENEVDNYFRYTQEEKINKKYGSKTNYYKCSGGNSECKNKSLSEQKLLKIIEEDFINGISFSDLEINIFKDLIYFELKNLGKIKENSLKLLKNKLANLKKEEEKYYHAYTTEDFDKLKQKHKENWLKTSNEIEEIENKIHNMKAVAESKEDYIKDYIYYINNLGTNFSKFPKSRKMKLIQAFFEYIVIDKIDSKTFNILEYKLNPIFELAYNKKKVLCNTKKKHFLNSNTSNLVDGLSKSKTSNSSVFMLNGRPTRNRT